MLRLSTAGIGGWLQRGQGRPRGRWLGQRTNEGNAQMPPYETPNLFADDQPYRTTYRCVRPGCGMTARLLGPLEHCPRCGAQMAVVSRAQRSVEDFLAAATKNALAGFDELLKAA